MKKIAFILLMICFSMIIFGCQKKEIKITNSEEPIYEINKKEIIVANLKLMQEGIKDEANNKYKKSMNYKTIVNLGEEAVPILIDMYKNNEIDEATSKIVTEVILSLIHI